MEGHCPVASYIDDIKDLKNVRLIDSKWMNETLQKWRNSAVFLINDETLPVLLKALKENSDPFLLREIPFKNYRFTKSQSWTYPLDDDRKGLDRKLLWEKVIDPNATFLDVGECVLKKYVIRGYITYLPGLRWILNCSSNVKEFAMAPLIEKDKQVSNYYESDSDSDDEEEHSFQAVWFNDTFQAPRVVSLILATPSTKGENRNNLQQLLNIITCPASKIFEMLPNLKALKLPSRLETCKKFLEGLEQAALRTQPGIKLESLDALDIGRNILKFPAMFSKYFRGNQGLTGLQEVKLPLAFETCTKEFGWANGVWRYVQETLSSMELDVVCEKLPRNTDISLGGCVFPNLSKLRISLDYDTFRGKLLTFDFNDLKQLRNLREFYFGSKSCVDKSWVTKKLSVEIKKDTDRSGTPKEFELQKLKIFHFHGNFKKEGLKHLGNIMRNLRTLELVIDQENFEVVMDIWPRLMRLKLLPCSDVPKEVISKVTFLDVVDESGNWSAAKVRLQPEQKQRVSSAYRLY